MKKLIISVIAAFSIYMSSFGQTGPVTNERYITGRTIDDTGREIISVVVPGKPPANYRAPIANYTRNAVVLGSVPAFSWSFGCSATAAAMAAGFYDNNGYPNVYTGPTNGGLMPMNNSSWGTVVINGETRDLCPLSATMLNLDGRTTRGHVDDYWEYYGSEGPDPYITNGWTEHTHADCTGDFMGTNQSDVGSSDGSTTFTYYVDGSPLYDYTGSEPNGRDGCHGMRLFYESRGYSVVQNYTQLIYGQGGNTLGFTFEQYMNEIDNGRPVMIHVSGHSMLGYGYDEATQLIYLHDTWDYQDHSMVWGGEYAGLAQWGVSVVQLYACNAPPIANFSGNPTNILTGESVSFTDLSAGNPTSWLWTFQSGTPATSVLQNPIVAYNSPGIYTVTLMATNANGSDTETKTGYIVVEDPDYCEASATCDEFISSLNFNTISNTSGCGTNGYTDYTGITTTIAAGTSYTITASTGPLYAGDQCGAWVDWNQDLDFEDDGEFFIMNNYPFTGIISPPADALNGPTRLRVRILYTGEIVPCGNVEWGETEDYTVIVDNPQAFKTLNLTVFLEGLFNPASQLMNKAMDENGEHFAGAIADQIVVKLAQASPPYTIVATSEILNLNQNGTCQVSFPSSLSGSYYIVITHRNSIETWSSAPVSFTDNPISYDFSNAASKTYGNNSILIGSKYCIYGGDVNQDGTLDTGDMTPVDNDASAYLSGYLSTDVNGDGVIDTADMTIVDNNSAAYISLARP
jgi:PKD repeat protein